MRFPLYAIFIFIAAARAEEKRGDAPDAPPSSPAKELVQFHVPPGFEVQLVAAEPEIQKPINLNFDSAGRLWATGSALYPWPARTDLNGTPIPDFDKTWHGMTETFRVGDRAPEPIRAGRDTVRILSDFAADGRARKIVTFADTLNIPTGIQPLPRKPGARGDTAILFSIPNIWRAEDTDGDGRADQFEPLYTGFGFTDTHGMASNFLYWIDGWIYGCHGFRNHSEVRDRAGRVTVFDSGNTYRFRPDGSAIEYYTHGQTNPFGLTVDPLGNFYTADSHSKPVMMLIRGGYYAGIGKQHDGLGFAPTITNDDHGSSAIAGIAYYADDKFPEEFRGNLFNGNPVTRRINRDRLEWHGSTPRAIRMPDFLTCDDPWFRPVQVKLGPDGALWIADFYNPIIGHYEVPLTHPGRDHAHGRIWRVVWRGEDARAGTPGSTRVPRVGEGVPPSRTSEDDRTVNTRSEAEDAQEVRRRETPRPTRETRVLPDLTPLDAAALVEKLADPNLIVRTLGTHELVERVGGDAMPPLRNAIKPFPFGVNETAAQRAHALIAFIRIAGPKIGMDDYELFSTPRFSGEEISRIYALKFTAEEHQWFDPDFESISHALLHDSSQLVSRAAWELMARWPTESILGNPIGYLRGLDTDDTCLVYQAKVALRDYLKLPNALEDLEQSKFPAAHSSDLIFDALLAVPTPESAEFILSQLHRIKLDGSRAGEFLQHVVLHLPEKKLGELSAVLDLFENAPASQRLNIADHLNQAGRQRDVKLPDDLAAWSQRVMLEALGSTDAKLLDSAIAAVRDAKMDGKFEPLQKIMFDTKGNGARRAAALEALMNLPDANAVAAKALSEPSPMALRKKAAELLGQKGDTATLLAALPNAPSELSTVIAAALVKTDAGCAQLLDLIEAGKASATLLRPRLIAFLLAGREGGLQVRATLLTKDLPPEDARLDFAIAQRAASFAKAKPDAAHGAQIFQQQCAVCHRFRNEGGNVGPNLDGVAARGVQRLVEDILDPNRNVDPAFRQTTIETRDGQFFVGGNVREQDGAVMLTDVAAKEIRVPLASIKTRTPSRFSLMPTAFETQLPAADLLDLLGYLLAPK